MIAGMEYTAEICDEMARRWPDNRTVTCVCHGHSVPAGYFATPYVDSFSAYPHQLHRMLKERFPYAVLNVIVTAIGGEDSEAGSKRFRRDVLSHRPDVITIDYGLNDRRIGLEKAKESWKRMIHEALEQSSKVILVTPSWDTSFFSKNDDWNQLEQMAEQITRLAEEFHVGLADSFSAFRRNVVRDADLVKYLSHGNHPSKAGHQLIAEEIASYFLAR